MAPDTKNNRYSVERGQFVHIRIAEQVLGHSLPAGAEVHHVNGIRADNRTSNLVICQDRSYHRLLHQRLNALRACGHPDWRKCKFCKHYSPISDLVMGRTRTNGYEPAPYHRVCQNEYAAAARRRKGLAYHPWKAAFGNTNARRPAPCLS